MMQKKYLCIFSVVSLLGVLGVVSAKLLEEKGFIGVQIRFDKEKKGIEVMTVLTNSPAGKAGVKKGDLITRVNGDNVTDLKKFVDLIQAQKPDDLLTLTVKRKDKEMDIRLTVGKVPTELK